MAYVDFKQAFGKVNRDKLWSVLQKARLKGRVYKALQEIYKQIKAQLRSSVGLSDCFHCPNGLNRAVCFQYVAFVQMLKDLFLQKSSAVINSYRKLVFYRHFKQFFFFERYLDIVTIRHSLAQIRTRHHDLEIERGRYRNIPRDQ